MITIVENTLRDGSYLIDFQFDRTKTERIAGELGRLGFKYIEVGHGLGLGAWKREDCGIAAENDITYITSAVNAAPNSKIGVFVIPGIGTLDDIDRAVDAGISFIRIGTNVDAFSKAREFSEKAKELGLLVTVNLMKSYGVKSYEFTRIAHEINMWQTADVIYLVDSAGCMMPEEVYEYIDRTKDRVDIQLGFHGHNNLSMAVANSLQAIRGGASYIDSSIRGMGRSAGNAQTEILVYFLQKMGISPIKTDISNLYKLADQHILPLMPAPQGMSTEDIHVGVSRFHTSFMPLVLKYSQKYKVDSKSLIRQVSDINCINPPEELFQEIAERISHD